MSLDSQRWITWVGSAALLLSACGDDGAGTSETDASTSTGGETTVGTASVTGSTDPGTTTSATDPTTVGTQGATESSTSVGPGTSTSDATSSSSTSGTTGGLGCGDAITTFEDGKAPQRELHVAPGGFNGPDCSDPQSPCATIEHAVGLATPGDAVRIHDGIYGGSIFLNDIAGTADAPIWIGGAPGEPRPVIEGGAESMHLTRPRYVIVHDLEVRGAASNGINCDDGGDYDDVDAARHLVFRDLYFHQIGQGGNQDCLKLSGVDDFFVLDSEFTVCGGGGSGSAVDHVGCHHGVLAGNYFHDLQSSGSAVQCKGGADDLEIRQNVFFEPGERGVNMGGSTGFQFFRPSLSMQDINFEARDIRVIANSFFGGVTPLAFVGCVDCLAANNTIDTPHNWILRILQETTSTPEYEFAPASGGVFVNNLVYFDRADLSTFVNVGPNTDAPSFTFTTNLWYAYDDPGQSDPSGSLPAPEQGGIVGQDPLLFDPGSGDYGIDGASPAAGAGTTVPGVVADVEGVCYLDPPSIGAREVVE